MNDNFRYWLALNKIDGLGPVRLKKLLDQYSFPQKICEALGIGLEGIDAVIAEINRLGVKAYAIDDPKYPQNLKNIYDPSPILYVDGDLSEKDSNAVAIVGTRAATNYGLETARGLARELSARGITIVSGLALGIDAAAHEGALEAGGRTLAVLGSGIDQIFPRTNSLLAKKIVKNGALISEFPLGMRPEKWTFPQRNRIISGLSLGVIVIEGGYESGAMITAKLALEQGREVFALPGNIGIEQSKGPHWLIKQGAKLIEGVEDVLEELKNVLHVSAAKAEPKAEKKDNLLLTLEEQVVYRELSSAPLHIDVIIQKTNLIPSQALVLLSQMEIKKFIKQLPGKMFVLG